MKNLFTVLLMLSFATTQMAACSDSDSVENTPSDTTVAQNLDSASVEDVVDGADVSEDAVSPVEETLSVDAVESSTDVTVTEIDEPEQEQLPSDPTEDPGQESSYYEFPAWHIPSPSEG